MLFKTASEIQEYLPQNAEFEFGKLKPFIKRQGEPHLILPHLGKALFDKLTDFYESYDPDASSSDSTSDDNALMLQLLEKVQNPLANYAYLKYIPFSTVTLGKAGISRRETNDAKTPFEYQTLAVENACHEAAWNGIEDLLLFLEQNIDESVFSDWKESDAYTYFKECFISTAKDFSSFYDIGNSRRTFVALRAMMLETEERVIAVISQAFADEIKAELKDDDVSEENKKVLKLISYAVANMTISKACVRLPVRINADGIQLISTSDRMTVKVVAPAETERLSAIIKDADESAEKYLKDLNDLLYDNIDDYDTFKNSSVYVDPTSADAKPFDQSPNGVVGF